MAVPREDDILGREEFPGDLIPRPQPAQVRQCHTSPFLSRSNEENNEKDEYSGTHHASFSSAGTTYRSDASVDLEKQASHYHKPEGWSPRSSVRASRDTERRHQPHDPIYQVGRGADSSPHHQTIRHLSDDDDDIPAKRSMQEPNSPVGLLFYFICLLPIVSFGATLYTLLLTLLITLTYPLRLIITRDRSLPSVLLTALCPALNFHLSRIASFPTAAAELQTPQTLTVLLSSSVLSIGVSIWAMVLGVFWIFAAIIGNPDGLDGSSDGRDLIRNTRRKWDDWLRLSVRPELRS